MLGEARALPDRARNVCEISPCLPAGRLPDSAARMARRPDSTSSASSAVLSRFGYAYAYPFAWRFS
jgi:hypothetical protein